MSKEDWMELLSWGVLGVMIGGRLGFVLFYEPGFYLANPLNILFVWEGGMSFHGGLLGVAIVTIIFAWKKNLDIRAIGDIVVVPAAIGLALGRFGNFINQELYGIETSLPWGITIPSVPGLRHPTQIYAMLADLSISAACFAYLKFARPAKPGRTFALFLLLYGTVRFLIEFLRVQEYPLTVIGSILLTRGQLLTLPLFVVGAVLWFVLPLRRERADS